MSRGNDLDRHLAALWFADVVGYTRLSEEDQGSAWRLIKAFQGVVREVIKVFGGRLVKFTGDGALAEFPSTELAVRSGHALISRFATVVGEARLGEQALRVGVHVGDVGATRDGDLIGDGVNVAARIQAETDPGQVWVSDDVRRQIRQHPELRFEARGVRKVKGIAQPLSLYAVVVTDEDEWVRPPRSMRGNRRRIIVGGLVIVVLGLAAAVSTRFWVRVPSELALDNPGRVAVIPFDNRTGDPALDPVGEIAADWVGEFLVRTGFVEVVDIGAGLAMRPSGGVSTAVLAHETGAGTLVTGSYYKQGDTLSFQARIMRGDGTLIAVIPVVSGASEEPIEVIERLRERIVTALAARFDPRLSNFEGTGGEPPSYAAYEEYVNGLEMYMEGDYETAASGFRQAIEIDSTFARARVWLLAAGGLSAPESVDSLTVEVERRESDLSQYDRHHARFFSAFLKGDLERAYVEAREMMKASPGSDDAIRETALSAMRIGRSNEAVSLLRSLSPDRGLSARFPEYWLYLSNAYLHLGEPDSALRFAREGVSRHPDHTDPTTAEALALIDLGRVTEAMQTVESLLHARPSQNSPRVGQCLIAVGLRALARGHKEAADTLMERTVNWMGSLSPQLKDDRNLDNQRLIQVYLVALLAVNRLQEASGLLEEDLNSESPSVSTLGVYGIVGARSGDMERASFALKELDGMEAFDIRIWRSRILAAMGNEQDAIRQLGSIEVDPWGVEMPVGVWPEFETLRDDPAFPDLSKLE